MDYFFTMGLDGQGTLVLNAQAPEPASALLLVLGTCAAAWRARRRMRS